MDFEHGLLLLLIGFPLSIGVMWLLLSNMDSKYNERLDDKDGNDPF